MNDDIWREKTDARLSALEKGHAVLEKDHAVNDVVLNSIARDVGEMKETNKWLVRLVIGALVLAVLTWVVQGGIAQ